MSRICIRQGRLVDPATGLDQIGDLYIANGTILSLIREPDGFAADRAIDASGQIVCPGFIDFSTRLREPGQSRKATFASETRAAAGGGFTTLCLQPDTVPVIDTPAVAELVKHLAEKAGYSHILPIAALTKNLEGAELTAMLSLKQSGCIAVGNGNVPMANLLTLRRAMEYAASHDLLVIIRPNDFWLGRNGCAHEGEFATRYGLPSIPEAAETIAVTQCLELTELTGCRLHFGQISCKRSLGKIAKAKQDGLALSADVAMHQLHLTERDMIPFDSNYHVLPPLRAPADRDSLRQGVADNVIDCICSDHQPHDPDAKLGAFPETEPGIAALETLLPLMLDLVRQNALSLMQGIASLTLNPAGILGLQKGRLTPGLAADICIFDPDLAWEINDETWISRGLNTPYWGRTVQGKTTYTFQGGEIIYPFHF